MTKNNKKKGVPYNWKLVRHNFRDIIKDTNLKYTNKECDCCGKKNGNFYSNEFVENCYYCENCNQKIKELKSKGYTWCQRCASWADGEIKMATKKLDNDYNIPDKEFRTYLCDECYKIEIAERSGYMMGKKSAGCGFTLLLYILISGTIIYILLF